MGGQHDAGPNATPAWARLHDLAREVGATSIRSLQDADPQRPAHLSWSLGPLTLDLSRQRLTTAVLEALIELADQRRVGEVRDAMLAGARINTTEKRSVLHAALRLPSSASLIVDGSDVVTDVHGVLIRMSDFAERVRSGQWRGATDQAVTTVINIGIGGSDLGPRMATAALAAQSTQQVTIHYVSNVDPADLDRALRSSDPETTLIIVASKTFTTIETMSNARAARTWLVRSLGESAVAQHFVAVSTNLPEIQRFGIDPANAFGFWDWVGGRYSVGSAIGLSTMIAIGPGAFRELLAGMADLDRHFATAPAGENLPLLMGLAAVWNRDFLGIPTLAVLPYSEALARFPAYLQQLIMESNGKSVTADGSPVPCPTSPVVWGEPGTNGQHSFYQLLHQGTDVVACDIIIVGRATVGGHATTGMSTVLDDASVRAQQDILVANAIAQASVLARGRTADEVAAAGTPSDLVSHKVMPGNRPVTVLAVEDLDPRSLGMMIALYEHAVLVQAVIWGINAFDQWGVELGKGVALAVEESIVDPRAGADLDPSTQHSITWYRRLRP